MKVASIYIQIAILAGVMALLLIAVTKKRNRKEAHEVAFEMQAIIRQIVDGSDLPHQQAEFVKKSIDSLFMDAIPQLQAQADTASNKK